MKPEIRCGFGLAGRVAAMANGISHHGEIRFIWRVNEHCPAHHSDIFPNGIHGVEFVDEAPPAMVTRIHGKTVDAWECARNRTAADSAYLRIMGAMRGEAREDAPEIACFARYFRSGDLPPFDLGRATGILAAQRGHGAAFVFADCNRAEIARGLAATGITAVFPHAPQMTHDKDRTAASVRAFVSDWKTLLAAKAIVSATERSGLLFPAFAAGTETLAIDAPTILQ